MSDALTGGSGPGDVALGVLTVDRSLTVRTWSDWLAPTSMATVEFMIGENFGSTPGMRAPTRTAGSVYICAVPMMEKTVVSTSAGRTSGIFTAHARRHPVQPSSAAASITSAGIVCSAE